MSKKSWNNGTRELEKIAGAVIFNERYDPNDKAYNRTPEEQKEIDDKIAGFNKNTEEYHEKNPYADPLRKYRRKRFRGEGAEEESSLTKAVRAAIDAIAQGDTSALASFTDAIDKLAEMLEGDEKVAVYEDLRDYIKGRLRGADLHGSDVEENLQDYLKRSLGHSEDNEQPGDEFFEILDDVRMVVDTNNFEALVAGVAVKVGRKLTDLEKAWVEEQIQDDELSEDNETFAKIDQDASNGLGKAELVEIYGADAVEAYIKDGVAKGKFEGDLEY